jgi:hypothetical protein
VETTRTRILDGASEKQAGSLQPAVILPSIKTQGQIVTSNKREPVLTLLDTEADFSIIDPSLALRLRLPIAEVALPRAPAWGSGSAAHCYGAYLIN